MLSLQCEQLGSQRRPQRYEAACAVFGGYDVTLAQVAAAAATLRIDEGAALQFPAFVSVYTRLREARVSHV